jgi:hypothetical protein
MVIGKGGDDIFVFNSLNCVLVCLINGDGEKILVPSAM